LHRFLGLAALTGFSLSLIVHITTVAGVDVASLFPAVLWLHVGAILIFIPTVLSSRKALANRAGRFSFSGVLPPWANAVFAIVVGYIMVNFLVSAHLMGNGSAAIVQGRYVLQNHGRLVDYLSEREYHLHKAYELRLFSGGWLIFYLLPAVYFLSRARRSP
jgi:hypothetical protein